MKEALKVVFPKTIPVLIGFAVLGIAYGILMNEAGYGPLWVLFASTLFFAGSAQYIAIAFLAAGINPIYAFFVFLIVNARHLFYGVSMLDKYKGLGWKKYYLMFALIDETFSIASVTKVPEDVDRGWFFTVMSGLHHIYWVTASMIGVMIGQVLKFNTEGLDFVLTALFVVIFIDYWQKMSEHKPALIGLVATLASLVIIGEGQFLLLAMVSIIALLLIFKPKMDLEGLA